MSDKKYTAKSFEFPADPFCEHCGHLEMGTPTLYDDGVEWCIDCIESDPALVAPEEVKKVRELWCSPKRCNVHPKYKAIKKPKARCVDCWMLWANKLEKKLAEKYDPMVTS